MERKKVLRLGFYLASETVSRGFSYEKFIKYISKKRDTYARILLAIDDYFVKYSKKFDASRYSVTSNKNEVLTNGTMKGLVQKINRGEIDIAVQPIAIEESSTKVTDSPYPYQLNSATFVTRMPEYKPEMIGILQTFSWPLWITILSVVIAMSTVYYVGFKRKYSLDKVFLHTFAVLLRHSSILRPSVMAENVLIYSWVVGTMFLCLAYDSVFLSFLAFPPINPIKDVPQLAKAVKKGDYHCVAPSTSRLSNLLIISEQENLRVLGKDIKINIMNNKNFLEEFIYEKNSQHLALIVFEDVVDILSVGNKFVSKDRFIESMASMMVRKKFCCKKMIDTFVHRLMASGLYFKYQSDRSFLFVFPSC